MKRAFRAVVCLFTLLLICAPQAAAAQKESFIVLPFTFHGPEGFAYLKDAVQKTFTNKLTTQDRLEPAVLDLSAGQAPAASDADAEKNRAKYKADYIVWGSVTVIGDTCNLDVRVKSGSGGAWTYTRETPNNQFMSAINSVKESMYRDIFKISDGAVAVTQQSAPGTERGVNQMNPNIVINEITSQPVYLNPNVRYAGTNRGDASIRSNTLPFFALGMEVVDGDNDGKNEIFLLEEEALHAFQMKDGKLEEITSIAIPRVLTPLNLRAYPRGSGKYWFIVNTVDQKQKSAANIYSFDGGGFTQEDKNVPYFMNVVNLPPDYRPTLIGQKSRMPRLFMPGVSEMYKSGNEFTMGRTLDLPDDANVFNFAYLPQGRDGESEKLILYNYRENLRVYTPGGSRLHETLDSYSGSPVGLETDPRMPGTGKEIVTIGDSFYMPMRIIAMDLEKDGHYELMVNKPISTASQIFQRYRSFPQSEIQSLYWDGMGLNLQWHTSRIKNSMADYALADAENNGTLNIVMCLNSHPGPIGVKEKKALIVLYPLDLTKTDPNTPPTSAE